MRECSGGQLVRHCSPGCTATCLQEKNKRFVGHLWSLQGQSGSESSKSFQLSTHYITMSQQTFVHIQKIAYEAAADHQ